MSPLEQAIAKSKQRSELYGQSMTARNVGESQYNSQMIADNSMNVEDFRHQKQSNLDAFANMAATNVARLGLRTVDTFGMPIGAIYKLAADAINPNEEVEMSDVYDNPISSFLRDLEEKTAEALPIYRSAKAQQDGVGGFFEENIMGLGGLDKLLNGLTYIVGMGAGMKAGIKGVSWAGSKIGKWGSKLAKAIDEGEDLANPAVIESLFSDTAVSKLDEITQGASKLFSPNTKEALKETAYGMWGSMVESAAEASETKKNIITELERQQLLKNGGQPLTEEQKKEIRSKAEKGGAANFLANIFMTGSANVSIFNKLFDNKWLNDVKKIGNIDIDSVTGTATAVADKAKSRYAKVFGSEIFKDAVIEGGQEGLQSLSNNLITAIMTKPELQSEQDTMDYITELGKVTGNTLFSKEGAESMILGAMIGGGAGYLINRKKGGEDNSETQAVVDAINKTNPTLSELYKTHMKTSELQELANGALFNNDRFTYENIKSAQLFTVVNGYDKAGKMDKFNEKLDNDLQLAENDFDSFRKQYGIKENTLTKEDAIAKIKETKSIAERITKTKNKILDNYGVKLQNSEGQRILETMTLLDTFKNDLSQRESKLIQELKDEGLDYVDFIKKGEDRKQEVQSRINEISKELTSAQDSKDLAKVRQLTKELNDLNGELTDVLLPSNYSSKFEQYLNNIQEKEKVEGQQLKTNVNLQKIKDLAKIQKYKEEVIKDYSALVDKPEARQKLLDKFNQVEKPEQIKNAFTVKSTDPDTGSENQVFMEKGSVIKLRRKVENKYGKDTKTKERDEFVEVKDTYFRNTDSGHVIPMMTVINPDGTESTIDVYNMNKGGENAPKVLSFTRAFEDTEKIKSPKYEEIINEERAKEENKDLTDDEVERKAYGLFKNKYGQDAFATTYANNKQSLNYTLPEWKLYKAAKNKLVVYKDVNGNEYTGFLSFYNGYLTIREYNENTNKFTSKLVNINNAKSSVTIKTDLETIAISLKSALAIRKESVERLKKQAEDTNAKRNKNIFYKQQRLQELINSIEESITNVEDVDSKNFYQSRLNRLLHQKHQIDSDVEMYEKFTTTNTVDIINEVISASINPEFIDARKDARDKYTEFKKNLYEANKQLLSEYNDSIDTITDDILKYINEALITDNTDVTTMFNMELVDKMAGDDSLSVPDKIGKVLKSIPYQPDPIYSLISIMSDDAGEIDISILQNNNYVNTINEYYKTLRDKKKELYDKAYKKLADSIKSGNLTGSDVENIIKFEGKAIDLFYDRVNSRFYDYLFENPYNKTDNNTEGWVRKNTRTFNTRSTGDSTTSTNFYEERFYRNIQKIDPENHTLKAITSKEEREKYGYGNKEGYYFKVVGKDGSILGTTTLSEPYIKESQVKGSVFQAVKKLFIDNGYNGFFQKNNKIDLDSAINVYKTLTSKTTEESELQLIDDLFKNQLIPILELRKEIDEDVDGINEYPISLVSWGVPVKTNEQSKLDEFLPDNVYKKLLNINNKTTYLKVATFNDSKIKTELGEFSVNSGFVYFVDESTGTIQSVKTKRVNEEQAKSLLNGIVYIQKQIVKGVNSQTAIKQLSELQQEGENGMLRRYFNFTNENGETKLMYDVDFNGIVSLIYGIDYNGLNKSISMTELLDNNGDYTAKALGVIEEVQSNIRHNIDKKELDKSDFFDVVINTKGDVSKQQKGTYISHLNDYIYANIKKGHNIKFNNGYVVIDKKANFKLERSSFEKPKSEKHIVEKKDSNINLKNLEKAKENSIKTILLEDSNIKNDEYLEAISSTLNKAKEAISKNPDRKSEFLDKIQTVLKNQYPDILQETINKIFNFVDVKTIEKKPIVFNSEEGTNEEPMIIGKPIIPTIVEEIKKDDNISNEGDYDDMSFMTVNYDLDQQIISEKDFQEAKKLFENKYKLPFVKVAGLIRKDDGGSAWGAVAKSGKVLLSDQAIAGTQYHEEFHVVSQFALNDTQREAVYKEWKLKNNNENATDLEVEEALAEEYRYYRMSNKTASDSNIIKRFFDYITTLIRNILYINGRDSLKDQLFKDIKKGKYYGKLSKKESKATFYSSSEVTVAEKKVLFDALYKNFVKEMLFKRQQDDIFDNKLLTVPEQFFLKELKNKHDNDLTKVKKDFDSHLGFSQKNALFRLLNNPSKLSEFLQITRKVKKKNGDIVEVINSRQLIVDSANNLENQYKTILNKNPSLLLGEFKEKILSELAFNAGDVNEGDGVVQETETINHYELAQNKIKLVLAGVMQQHPEKYNRFRNASEFLNELFAFNKKVNSSDADLFFEKLGANYKELYIALGLNNTKKGQAINKTEAVEELIAFQNSFFKYLNKQHLNFKLLKIVNDSASMNKEDSYIAVVDSMVEKAVDSIVDEWISEINIYKVQKGKEKLTNQDLREIFKKENDLHMKEAGLDKNLKEGQTTYLIDGINANNTNKIRNELKKAAFKKYESSDKYKQVFSLLNADGKSIYNIQDHSSLSKRYENYVPSATYAFQLQTSEMKNKLIPLLGIDYKSTSVDEYGYSTSSDGIAGSKLDELDLQLLSYHGVMKAVNGKGGEEGFIPFLFSGDKSTLWALPIMTNKPSESTNAYNKFFDKSLKEAVSKNIDFKNSKKQKYYINGSETLGFFDFLKNYNPNLHSDLLNLNDTKDLTNGQIQEVNLLMQEHFDKKSSELYQYFTENQANLGKHDKVDDVRNYVVATSAALIEQANFLTGDIIYYSDFTKRIPAIASTKENLSLAQFSIDFFNNHLLKNPKEKISADSMRALIVDDVFVKSENMVEGVDDDYSGNNVADAQAYLSTDAAKFLIWSSGRWNSDYKKLFEAIESDKLSRRDFERIHNEINEHLNALKPQYYGFYNNTNIPIFYKMSVVPLYEGYTRGKNLDTIRQIMRDGGIHMLMLDSANKVGRTVGNPELLLKNKTLVSGAELPLNEGKVTLSMYDGDGNFGKFLKHTVGKEVGYYLASDSDANGFQQVSPWKYLGIQVETNNQKNKNIFGTQMRVLALADLQEDSNLEANAKQIFDDLDVPYNNALSPKKNIVDYFDSLINEKHNIDKTKLMKKLGIDENYNIVDKNKSLETLRDALIGQARTSGATNTFIKSIKNLTKYDLISNKVKLQSIIQKMMDLTKQKLFGEPKVQVSSLFFESKDNNIQKSRDLKAYYKTENGKENFYLEVYLPLEYADMYKGLLEDDFDSNGILRFKDKKDVSVRTAIGYRIPTQYVNAIDNVVIKGFIPGVSRNQVVVPAEITTKTGSDFDVDKLNMFFTKTTTKYEYPKSEDVKSKIFKQLTDSKSNLNKQLETEKEQSVINEINQEIDNINSVIFNFDDYFNTGIYPDEVETLMGNIIEATIKDGKKTTIVDDQHIDNKIIKFYSKVLQLRKKLVVSPNEQTKIKPAIKGNTKTGEKGIQQYIGYKNDDANKANAFDIKWLMGRRNSFMTAKSTLGIQALAQKHHTLCQLYDIMINDNMTSFTDDNNNRSVKLSTLLKHFGLEPDTNGYFDLSRTRDISGIEIISKILSETIDATVDAAKDDYIATANFKQETAGVINLLIRLGVDYKTVLAFISQPSIVKLIKDVKKGKNLSSFAENEYFGTGGNVKLSNVLSWDYLTKELESGKINSNEQESIKNLFLNLRQHADMLGKFVKLSTFDTKGVGTSIDENQLMLNEYEKNKDMIFKYFVNSREMFESTVNKPTFLETFKNVSEKTNDFTKKFFIFEEALSEGLLPEFKKYLDNVFVSKNKSDLEKTQHRQKAKEIAISYIIQRTLALKDKSVSVDDIITNVANRLKQYKLENRNANFLVDNLVAGITKGSGSVLKNNINNVLLHNSAKLEREEANDYTDSWMELYGSNKELALDLARLAVFQSGTLNSPVTIYNLIPYEIKKELAIHEISDDNITDFRKLDSEITKVVSLNINNKNIYDRNLIKPLLYKELPTDFKALLGRKNITTSQWDDAVKKFGLNPSILLEKLENC